MGANFEERVSLKKSLMDLDEREQSDDLKSTKKRHAIESYCSPPPKEEKFLTATKIGGILTQIGELLASLPHHRSRKCGTRW